MSRGCFSCWVAQSWLTLCNSMDCRMPRFPVLHYFPEFAQTHVHWVHDAIWPCPPLLPPSPALNLSQHQGLFQWVSSSHYGEGNGTPLQYSCLENPMDAGALRVGHDWATSLSLFTFMHWRRKWQPTPVFLPRESQGRGSLVGCHLWGRTESDTTEVT